MWQAIFAYTENDNGKESKIDLVFLIWGKGWEKNINFKKKRIENSEIFVTI